MKKSQILAALAFAFALGVAMPVMQTTSVFAASDVFDIATTAVDGCDVQQILANIRAFNNSTYGSYAKYAAVYNAYKDAAQYKEVDFVNLANEIEQAIKDVKTAANDQGTYTRPSVTFLGASQIAAGTALRTPADVLTTVRNDARTIRSAADYTKFNTLYNLMQKNANAVAASDLESAVHAIDGVFSIAGTSMNSQDIQDYVNGSWAQKPLYLKYVDMIKAVNKATDALNALSELEAAVNDFQDWAKIYSIYSNESNTTTMVEWNASTRTPIKDVMYLVETNTIMTKYTSQWQDLVAAVEKQSNSATTTVKSGVETSNKDIVNSLVNLFRAATASTSKNAGIGIELSTLSNVGGACGTTNNNGTGEGTNNGEGDDKKDPNAPDTGLLADAEANASTTVAMVAGIATALTAAGAGVVAYRNARRSTRK